MSGNSETEEGHRVAAQLRMAQLNTELKRAEELGLLTPDMHRLHLREILNGIEDQIKKSRGQIDSYQQKIHQEQGRIRGLERMGTLMLNLVMVLNNKNAEKEEHPDDENDEPPPPPPDPPEGKEDPPEPPKESAKRSTRGKSRRGRNTK